MSVNPPDRFYMEHIPTGERVCVELSFGGRGLSWAHKHANSLLRSRLFAEQSGCGRSNREVAIYDLPDDMPYPFDLGKYKSSPEKD